MQKLNNNKNGSSSERGSTKVEIGQYGAAKGHSKPGNGAVQAGPPPPPKPHANKK